MIESNLRHCKVCGELKERTVIGKFDKRNKKYADETGSLWNGRTCPKCHTEKIKNSMQKLRFQRSLDKSNEEKKD